jgi:hypothetical protein
MNIKEHIGETAGRIWQALSTEGPHTLVQLKKKVAANGDLVPLAVGWLAREDQIELATDKRGLLIQLK